MNTLVASKYGQVRGQIAGSGLVMEADAKTPRLEKVKVSIVLDSPDQLLYLLAILRAVARRIDQVQLKDREPTQADAWDERGDAALDEPESGVFESNSSNKHKVYGRFPHFLIYEQFDQGRLRVFFAVQDEQKRIARFDIHSGEVQAFRALAERALLVHEHIDLLLRDELSLSIALSASRTGLAFEVQTPLWHAHFLIGKAHSLGTLAVFVGRALGGTKATPIRFETGSSNLVLRKRTDGRVLAEFHSDDSSERLTLSSLQLYQMEILARFVLHLCFEPESTTRCDPVPENLVAAPRG